MFNWHVALMEHHPQDPVLRDEACGVTELFWGLGTEQMAQLHQEFAHLAHHLNTQACLSPTSPPPDEAPLLL